MITAGVDAGAECLKVAVISKDSILSYSIIAYQGRQVLSVAQQALDETVKRARIREDKLEHIVATGVEQEAISFAHEQVLEAFCCAQGVSWLLPSARTIIDLGAEKTLVIKCEGGRVLMTARNDKCAAGTSIYLKMVSNLLGIEMEKMGELSLRSEKTVDIESTCAVFAETEIISLIHQKYAPRDIVKGVFKGWVRRIYPLLVNVGFERDVGLVGGMAKNIGIITEIERQIGFSVLVPNEPMIVTALGAAVIAAQRKERHRS